MRREILFTLLGFLGGFVVAGIVFWQPAALQDGASPSILEATPKSEAGTASAEERTRTRMAVFAQESSVVAPDTDSAREPKGPAELFHDVIGTLKDMDPQRRRNAVHSLMSQLHGMGPDGLRVLRDYFRLGQDVNLPNGETTVTGWGIMQMGSLRALLVNSLDQWPGNEAIDLAHEALRTTSQMSEAAAVIFMLENRAPGVYRAEAIQTVQRLAGKLGGNEIWPMNDGVLILGAMQQFKATELLPAAEAFVRRSPGNAAQFIASLDSLPADVRVSALQRLLSNEALMPSVASNPSNMRQFNYSEPVVAQGVARVFAANPDKRFRENFLQNLADTQMVGYALGGLTVQPASGGSAAADRAARLQGRLAFLDTIAPQCSTPVLQERLQDTREAIQKAIANPDADGNGVLKLGSVTTGGGTLILSGSNTYSGSTIISSGTLRLNTTTDKK